MSSTLDYKKYAPVLEVLIKASDHWLTANEIGRRTGLSHQAVSAALRHLAEAGFHFTEHDGTYQLQSKSESLSPIFIACGLKARKMGCEIHAYKTIGSTNEVARRLAEAGAPEGTLVVSEKQTKGRGRLGRMWYSPSGPGLYFSVILRPELDFPRLPALSLVAALSICRIVEKCGITAKIKWPNDCLIQGKKFAGILVELSAELDRVSYAVLGIGINVNHNLKDFPPKIRSQATSLAYVSGGKLDRALILRSFLFDFERLYNSYCRYGFRIIAPELTKRSVVIGEKVTISYGGTRISGTALGFDPNGALRVRDKEGVKVFAAGEVSLRK